MRILQSSVFRALCAIIIGVLLIKFPDNTVKGITVAIGVLFLVSVYEFPFLLTFFKVPLLRLCLRLKRERRRVATLLKLFCRVWVCSLRGLNPFFCGVFPTLRQRF